MRISEEQAKELEEIFHGFVHGKNYHTPSLTDADGNVTEWRTLTAEVNGARTIEIMNGMFLIDPRTIEEVGKRKSKKEKKENIIKLIFKSILKTILNFLGVSNE
jgi:hypothetical protein